MAYNNALVIKRLRERGELIKNENWEELIKKNNSILQEIKQDKTILDQLQRPVSVFATF
jgi:hypothetical protein